MRKVFSNARIFDGERFIDSTAVLIDNGQIQALGNGAADFEGIEAEDLGGKVLAPAFIDLQIYGGNNQMFSQKLNAESIQATYDYSREGGAAYFMITMATNSMENFYKGIDAARKYIQDGGSGLLGLHMEGPFLNIEKKGAHIERYIHKPTIKEVDELLKYGEGVLKMMTIAPENCDDLIINRLKEAGVLLSAGHTNASYLQGMKAFEKIPAATHLFNAMSPLQHRAPGMVGAIYEHPSVISSLVCDGIHVDYAAVRISQRLMGRRLFYITDAVTEVKEGEYTHLFRGDRYTLPDGTLSGSSLTMLKSVYNGVHHAKIPLEDSLAMATSVPASLLDQRIGKISKGYDGELVVLENDLTACRLTGTGQQVPVNSIG